MQEHVGGLVHTGRDSGDLGGDRIGAVVDEAKLARLLACLHDRLGELARAGATAFESFVDLGSERAESEGALLDERDLLVAVARTTVDGDHAWEAELAHDPEVAAKVGQAGLDRCEALIGPDACAILDSAVVL